MHPDEIKELIRIVEESGISELEVSHGRRRIRISKGTSAAPSAAAAPPPAREEVIAGSDPAPVPVPSEDHSKVASNLKQITSPMVGTVYRAPAPGSDPFIEVGQPVSVGQTVCIVEAMKLMNEIGSDFNGVVRQILVDNAEPVEFGQPLFLVEEK